MAFSAIELKQIQKVVGQMCRRRSSLHPNDKVRTTYEIKDQEVEIFESKPRFNKPSEWSKTPCAMLKHSRSSRKWKIYWMRPDGRWYPCEAETMSNDLDELVAEIDHDRNGTFFGKGVGP